MARSAPAAHGLPWAEEPRSSTIIETDIPARLDSLPFGGHLSVIVALGITWVLDGLEVTLAGSLSGELTQRSGLGLTSAQSALPAAAIYAERSSAPFSLAG